MPVPKNMAEFGFRWSDVVIPQRDLENATLTNRQRMIRMLTTDPMALADVIDAATVILLSDKAHEALKTADPKALEQLERAMDLASPDMPNPYPDGMAVVYRDHAKPQYAKVSSMAMPDSRLVVTFGDGYSRYLPPWNWRIRPDDDPQAE